MEWSLVLVSQGIESIVDHDAEGGWGLIVDEQDRPRADEAIRLYRAENLHWPWQQRILTPEISFDWGSLAWALLMCVFFGLGEWTAGFREAGLMSSDAVARGEWWRLFTAIFLHADAAHLASNAVLGFVLLGLAMGRYGTGLGLLAAFLAGAIGNAASWLAYRIGHHSLGASGMVMGALGLLAVQSAPLLQRHRHSLKYFAGAMAGGLMLFVLMGLSPGTDIVAHFGGFSGGVLLGTVMAFAPRLARSTAANLLAGAVFSALVILSWWLALN